MNKIYIYTDGSSLGNPGPGGWAAILKYKNSEKEISGGEKFTTNNRMELLAVIESLDKIKNKNIPIELYTDSKYVVDSINKGWLFNWAKKPNLSGKKNADLWQRFLNIYPQIDLTIKWIKAHNGHPENERCDQMAKNEAFAFK
jgi:ribonuclease HI